MATSYEFLVFSDGCGGMTDPKIKSRIKRHAMKNIGATRRRPVRRKTVALSVRIRPLEPRPREDEATVPETVDMSIECQLTDDRALYDPCVRALSCAMDPFDSSSTRLDSTARSLLHYFEYYSSNFPHNLALTVDVGGVLTGALQDGLTINCLLSAAASRIFYVQGIALWNFREKALSCTARALELFQQRLTNGSGLDARFIEPMIDCILYLAAGALYRADAEGFVVHVDAVVRLINLGGGVHLLQNPRNLVRALSMDDLVACMRLKPCRLDSSYHLDALGIPSRGVLQMTEAGLDAPAVAFRANCLTLLPESLQPLVVEIIEHNQSFKIIQLSECTLLPDKFSERQRQILHTLSIRNRLLASPISDYKSETLRIALVVWTLLPPGDMRQIRTAQTVARRLGDILQQHQSPSWTNHEDLRFWCLLVGFFAARTDRPMQAWFVSQVHLELRLRNDLLDIQTNLNLFGELCRFQRRFLSPNEILRSLTESLVELLLPEMLLPDLRRPVIS